jgi:ABC-type Zn uptake system ZnuABC Zn-binding protein ZnuA
MPKKREDLDKIVEEVESEHHHSHGHEHEHHHHHHGDLEDAVAALEVIVDSLTAQSKSLEAEIRKQGTALAVLYRVTAWIVEALASESEEDRVRALKMALEELRKAGFARGVGG